VAKNKEGKIPKRTGQVHKAQCGMGLEKPDPDTQREVDTVMFLDRATQYRDQKSALLPDTPNLSPNQIDYLKALLGF